MLQNAAEDVEEEDKTTIGMKGDYNIQDYNDGE